MPVLCKRAEGEPLLFRFQDFQKGRGLMRCLVQRVTEASVRVDAALIGSIGRGLLILLGVSEEDDEATAEKMVRKLLSARIFEDGDGKTNLSLSDISGELLIISQFTLYADYRKGNRPSFIRAGSPEKAKRLYEYFIEQCRKEVRRVEQGSFGADMKVSLTNDGPFTILYDSEELSRH